MTYRDGDRIMLERSGTLFRHQGAPIPYGNTAERPAAAPDGYLRYNGQAQGLEVKSPAGPDWTPIVQGLDCYHLSKQGEAAADVPVFPVMETLLEVALPAGVTNVHVTGEAILMPLTATLGLTETLAILALYGNYVGEPEILMKQVAAGTPVGAELSGMPMSTSIAGSFRQLDPSKPLEVRMKVAKQKNLQWAVFDPGMEVLHWSRGIS
jgi:hypothetical protein